MFPTVSVIIPFYREGPFLIPAIESVFQQTFQDWEMVLVDNNASEDTRQIARHYATAFPEKVRLFHEPEQGVISARKVSDTELSENSF